MANRVRDIPLILVVLLALPLTVWANPFLVCDPPTEGSDPEWYELDGLPWLTGQYDAEADLSMRIDLVGTPPGVAYTVKARACNVWGGCGEWSDTLNFTRATEACGTPSIRIVPE